MWGGSNERGVSEVLGAILVFAILVSGVAVYQVTVVPQTNEEREFEHSQAVQKQMIDLRNDLQEAAVSGRAGSASLDLGVSYPVRSLTLNPPEGAGSLRTVGTGDSSVAIRVGNAKATDAETDDLWDGDGPPKKFSTGALQYAPTYTYYQNAPVTTYENGILYERYERGDETIVRTQQDVVDGRQISLTALGGERATSRTDSIGITARPLSPAIESIAVSGDSAPLRVTIPTSIPEEVWIERLLAQQIDDDDGMQGPETGDRCGTPSNPSSSDFVGVSPTDGDGRYIVDCLYEENADSLNELTLVFQRQENGRDVMYSLAMSKVGVASDATDPPATYITTTEGDGADVSLDGRQKVVFQVRDEFNNPTDGQTIDVSLAAGDPGSLVYRGSDEGESVSDVAVGPDGEVELFYEAPTQTSSSPVTVELEASFSGTTFGADAPESAVATVQVINASRVDRTEPLVNPSSTLVVKSASFDEGDCDNDGSDETDCALSVTFANRGGADVTVTDVRYSFYASDSQGASGGSFSASMILSAFGSESYAYGSEEIELAGSYEDLPSDGVTLGPSEEKTLSLFALGDSGTLNIDESEFFVISAIADGERRTFFIAPEAVGNGDQEGGGGGGGSPSS